MGAVIMLKTVAEAAVRGWDSRREAAVTTLPRLAAARAGDDPVWFFQRDIRRTDVKNPPGVEGDAFVFELGSSKWGRSSRINIKCKWGR